MSNPFSIGMNVMRPFGPALKMGKFMLFRPKIYFDIEMEKYRIKTAENISELYSVFVLRYQNFIDSKKGIIKYFHLDVDEYDFGSDHIIIMDKTKKNKIVGTYRVRTSVFNDSLYSESEFNLDEFKKLPGIKMELGRACIDPLYRNGTTIDLLWKGIAKYSMAVNARYLCGCSSIKTQCPQESLEFLQYFRQIGVYSADHSIIPHSQFNMNLDDQAKCELELDKKLPPLLKTYIKAGAKVYGHPALDRDFECIDFFTILDFNQLTPVYHKRYYAAKSDLNS